MESISEPIYSLRGCVEFYVIVSPHPPTAVLLQCASVGPSAVYMPLIVRRFCLRPVNSSRIATLDTSPLSYLPPTKTISSSLPAIYSSLVAVNVLSGRLGWMRQSSSCVCPCCKLCLRTLE